MQNLTMSTFGYYNKESLHRTFVYAFDNKVVEKGEKVFLNDNQENTGNIIRNVINITNAAAYIPVISSIIGLARVILTSITFCICFAGRNNVPERDKQIFSNVMTLHKSMMLKGIIELTSITPILMLLDIIATTKR